MRIRLMALSMVLCLMAGAAIAQDHDSLFVSGKVRVFAKADRARVVFEINGFGSSLHQAFDKAGTKMDSIIARLAAIGLSENDLSTSLFTNRENYDTKAFLSHKKDYQTTMTAAVTTRRVDLLKSIIIILSESEVDRVANVSFELVDYEQLRKDALVKATAIAREKATLVAEQLGITLAGVLRFEEIKTAEPVRPHFTAGYESFELSGPFNAPLQFSLDEDAVGAGIFPEEIQFDSEVKVVFAIGNDSGG